MVPLICACPFHDEWSVERQHGSIIMSVEMKGCGSALSPGRYGDSMK